MSNIKNFINPQIFREYDIRGKVNADLNPEIAKTIGLAAGSYLRKRGLANLVVGRDCRLSSDDYKNALIEGLLSTGCTIVDIGIVTTPIFYFSLFHLDKDGGVMITGSHNPPEFNGFKVAEGKATIYGEKIQEIRTIAQKGDFFHGSGSLSTKNILNDYLDTIKNKVVIEKCLKVAVDCGNGTSSLVIAQILKDLGCQAKELFCTMDGNFPNHFADPTVPANLKILIETVKKERYDVGVAFDGDADRIGVVDDEGKIIWGDQLLILYSRDLLQRMPGAPIIFEVKCSQTLVDDIKKHGGKPIMWKTGHSLIKKKMKEVNSPLAGEMSGHIFFADNYYGFDDAIFACARLLEILSKTDKKLSQMLSDVPKTYSTPEIRIDCPDDKKFDVVEKIRKYFDSRYKTIDIDGVRVVFEDGWGLIRPSNTQPVIVLRFESTTQEGLKRIRSLMENKLKELL
jgi:phosphomannomutase/phosphoglucomutase